LGVYELIDWSLEIGPAQVKKVSLSGSVNGLIFPRRAKPVGGIKGRKKSLKKNAGN
jgi:hypothetical protein